MKGTIHPLTGLRFVAAMMVLVSHYPVPGTPGPLLRLMQSGYAGVTFFFVLSGFILTYNYADRFCSDARDNLVPYFVSRFARIYPVYLLTNLFMWFLGKEGGPIWLYLLALQP